MKECLSTLVPSVCRVLQLAKSSEHVPLLVASFRMAHGVTTPIEEMPSGSDVSLLGLCLDLWPLLKRESHEALGVQVLSALVNSSDQLERDRVVHILSETILLIEAEDHRQEANENLRELVAAIVTNHPSRVTANLILQVCGFHSHHRHM